MSQEKYIGMDVHQATISVTVMDSSDKLIMECILGYRMFRAQSGLARNVSGSQVCRSALGRPALAISIGHRRSRHWHRSEHRCF